MKFSIEETNAIKEAFKWSIYRMENEVDVKNWPNRQYRYERINEVKDMKNKCLKKLEKLTRKRRYKNGT